MEYQSCPHSRIVPWQQVPNRSPELQSARPLAMWSRTAPGVVRLFVFRVAPARLPSIPRGSAIRSLAAQAGPVPLRRPAPTRRPSLPATARPWSTTQRRFYYDPNDPRIRHAKPLWSVETPGRILRSPGTHAVALFAVVAAFVFYFSNLETVPISGRTRFNCYSAETVRQAGEAQYKMVLYDIQKQGGKLLPDWDPR